MNKRTIWMVMTSGLVMILLFSLAACQGESEQGEPATIAEKKDINPNGSSELALMMREMHEAAVAAKAEIEKGQTPGITVDFAHMTEAEPTNPKMIAFEEFEPLAKSYITAMQALATAEDSTQAAQAYTTVINTCMSCHEVSCKGPIPRIKRLYLAP